MPVFEDNHPIADVVPAKYNPRHLPPEAFQELQESLRQYGVVKPVVLNGDGTIIAGHQRVKAAKAIGLTTVPAMVLDTKVQKRDEIAFNMIHNMVERNVCDVQVSPRPGVEGWDLVDWGEITVMERQKSTAARDTARLVARFGAYGSAVADSETGQVVANQDYALACHDYKLPLLVWWAEPGLAAKLGEVLTRPFGEYDSSVVMANSYQQWAIQPNREAGRLSDQVLYHLVLPVLTKDTRIVDLGAGKAERITALAAKGYQADFYEPFLRKRGTRGFDMTRIVASLKGITRRVNRHGLYDIVVSDSVMNAAINDDYHEWIGTMNWALTADHGTLFFQTRSLKEGARTANSPSYTAASWFLTKDNVKVSYRMGEWTSIRLHTPESLHAFVSRFFGQVEIVAEAGGSLRGWAKDPLPQPRAKVEEALREEFNMPYPQGFKHDQEGPLVAAVLARLEESGRLQ